jgi:hypothetical protein
MGKPNSSAAKSQWIDAAIRPISEEGHRRAALEGRTLVDLPATIPRLARDVAKLTCIRCYLRQVLPEVTNALERLRAQPPEDWDQPFLVADADVFDWRTAPLRR